MGISSVIAVNGWKVLGSWRVDAALDHELNAPTYPYPPSLLIQLQSR